MKFSVQLPTDRVERGDEYTSGSAVAQIAQAIERAGDCDTAFDVGHVGAAVQGMTGTMQLVRNIERRRVTFASSQIIDDDLQMSRSFFGEDIEQHRIHFERWLFDHLLFAKRRFDR